MGYVETRSPNKSLRWMLGGFSEKHGLVIVVFPFFFFRCLAFVFSSGYVSQERTLAGARLGCLVAGGLGPPHDRPRLWRWRFRPRLLAPATAINTGARSGGISFIFGQANIPRIYGLGARPDRGPPPQDRHLCAGDQRFATTAVTRLAWFWTALAPNAAALSIARKGSLAWRRRVAMSFAGFAPGSGFPLAAAGCRCGHVICTAAGEGRGPEMSPGVEGRACGRWARPSRPRNGSWKALVVLAMFLGNPKPARNPRRISLPMARVPTSQPDHGGVRRLDHVIAG